MRADDLVLEIYYDSTVEPFEVSEFDIEKVERLLRILRESGVKIKVVDTAGWSRRMLQDVFKKVSCTEVLSEDIFGSGKRRGWFFGREIPALLIVRGDRILKVYPHREKDEIKTVEDGLEELVEQLGDDA